MRRASYLLAIPLLFLVNACNSLFYYPDQNNYSFPNEEKLSYRSEQILADDGVELHAWILDSKGPARGTVLHFHGNAENMSSHYHYVSWLPAEGYQVITFDYRGYGKSSGEPSREGMVQDGIAALRFADKHRIPTAPRLIVIAQSIGGAIAVPAIAEAQVPIDALILDSAFADYRRLARGKLSDFWMTWPLQWPLSFLVTNHRNPVDYISQIRSPILFLHATADPIVPLEEGKALFDAATQERKEFWKIPVAQHTPAFRDRSPYRAKVAEYLSQNEANAPSCNRR